MNTNSSALLVREIDDPRVDAMVNALQDVYSGLFLLCVEYVEKGAGDSRALGGEEAVTRLLSSTREQGVAPDLQIPVDLTGTLPFEWRSSHDFEAELLACLASDGASAFAGDEDDARHLAREFVEALFGAGHRAQASIYVSAQAWSPWFGDAGQDHTFVAEDGWTGRWWLLCMTGGG